MPNYSYFNPGTPNPVYIDPMIGVDAFTKNRQNALLMKQRAEELVYERGRDTRADERNAVADLLAQAEEERKIAKRAEDKIKAEAEGKLDAGKIQTATLKKLFNPVVISSPELSQERWASGAVAAKYPELKEFNDIMQGFAKTLPPEKFNQKVAALVEMNNEKKKKTLPTTAMGKFIAYKPDATPEEIITFAGDLAKAQRADKEKGKPTQMDLNLLEAEVDAGNISKEDAEKVNKMIQDRKVTVAEAMSGLREQEKDAAEKRTIAKEKRAKEEKVVQSEEKIILNMDNPASQAHMAYFNRHSKAPYVYVWVPEKEVEWGRDKPAEAKKIDLPVRKGKQLTAEDISATAEKYGKTVEAILQQLGIWVD